MENRTLHEFIERSRGADRRDELELNAVRVLAALDAAGVEALLLKGPALTRLLYTHVEQRGFADIDVLVPEDQLRSARDALIDLGYTNSGELFGIRDVAGVQHAEMWARRSEHGPLWIDLHWKLGGCEAPAHVVWDALARTRVRIEIHGREAWVPGREGLALHLALHAAQHGPHDTKALGDLARGVERWPLEIWGAAADIARRVAALPMFSAGLRLSSSGAALASQLGLEQTARLDWEIRHRSERPRGTYHLRAVAQARGPRQLAEVLRGSLVPTRAWITWELPWAAKSRPHLIAAYLWHILRAPAWGVRVARYARQARRMGV